MMFTMRTSLGATLALFQLVAGCSGGSGAGVGPSQEAAADRALANTSCYLGLQVPGVRHDGGVGCSGTGMFTTVTGLTPNTIEAALSVDLGLNSAPAVGPLDVQAITIDVPSSGTSQLWDAPVAACTAEAVDSAFDDFFSWTYYRIDISCSEPAVPQSPNTGQPLVLGDFVIVSFFTQP
jgi:hypothetical protein